MIAYRKRFINLLFPNAKIYIVDGLEVTRAEFDRIPASLLRTVAGEDNGKKRMVCQKPAITEGASFLELKF